MIDIYDTVSQIAILTQRIEDITREIRVLGDDVRRYHTEEKKV